MTKEDETKLFALFQSYRKSFMDMKVILRSRESKIDLKKNQEFKSFGLGLSLGFVYA